MKHDETLHGSKSVEVVNGIHASLACCYSTFRSSVTFISMWYSCCPQLKCPYVGCISLVTASPISLMVNALLRQSTEWWHTQIPPSWKKKRVEQPTTHITYCFKNYSRGPNKRAVFMLLTTIFIFDNDWLCHLLSRQPLTGPIAGLTSLRKIVSCILKLKSGNIYDNRIQ